MPTKRRTHVSPGRNARKFQLRLAAAERAVQSRQREIDALHQIATLALCEQPLQVVLQAIVQEVSACTGFPIIAIEFYDVACQLMEFAAVTGIPLPAGQPGLRIPVDQTLSGLVARSGQALIEHAAQNRPEYASVPLRQLGVQTFVCIPLANTERVIGTLALAHPGAIPLDEHLLPLAHSLASMIATLVARRQAEDELQVALTKYRTLFDAFPLGITVSDATGRIVESNAMAEHLLGLEREEHNQRAIDGAEWRIVRPDGTLMPCDEYASVRALKERHVVDNVEMGVTTPAGLTTWINVTAAPLPLDNYGVVITYGDITARREAELALRQLNATLEQRVARRTADLSAANTQLKAEMAVRKQAEQALRESEARFRRLAENAPDIIYRFDYLPEPHFSYVSPAATAIIGYRPEEHYADAHLGQRIIHPDDALRLQQLMEDPTTLHEPVELRWLHRDGSVVWIEQRNVPIFDVMGRLVAIEGIARDITTRKAAEVELHRANAELARAARLKDEFLANMSHELRTPLNAILGRAQLLAEELYGPLNPKQLAAVQGIDTSSRHLLTLINEILDLARIEAGKLLIEITPVSVAEVCRMSLHMVTESALQKQIALTTSYDPQVNTIPADERRLVQILINLLSNAVKFTPGGGQVGLEVQGDPALQRVTFTVWDTGIGIATADLPHLFQPFTQIDSRLNRQHSGAGLGLALVKRLSEAHGGNVSVESTPGQGSRFSVSLPWHTTR